MDKKCNVVNYFAIYQPYGHSLCFHQICNKVGLDQFLVGRPPRKSQSIGKIELHGFIGGSFPSENTTREIPQQAVQLAYLWQHGKLGYIHLAVHKHSLDSCSCLAKTVLNTLTMCAPITASEAAEPG